MKIFIPLLVVVSLTASTTLDADGDCGEEKEPQRIQVSDLAKLGEGEEAIVRFKVSSSDLISGGVPEGQARSFGIQPVTGRPDARISVPVVGELADAMERFGFAPPNPRDRLAGTTNEARGKVYMSPAPVNAPEKGRFYQFRMGDLKGFRIVSQSQADAADQEPARRESNAELYSNNSRKREACPRQALTEL